MEAIRNDIDENNVVCAIRDAAAAEPYARRMGIELCQARPGYALCRMTVDPSTLNLFGMAHGGVIFSLLDEAFQIACNTHGSTAYALNVSVTYIRGAASGETLEAEAKEVSLTARTGTYEIRVTGGDGSLVAVAQALAYRKKEPPPFLREGSLNRS